MEATSYSEIFIEFQRSTRPYVPEERTLTHLWSWALLEKLPTVQLLKNFPIIFYGTRRFITVFTRALHWSLPSARSIQSVPSYRNLSKIYFNIAHPSTSWSLSFWLSHQYPILILLHSCCMPCPSHPPWLDHYNYTWRRVQVMKLLIMQLFPNVCHFISLRSKYSSDHPVFKHPLSMFLP
jgi:hypothetical protein